MVSLRRAIFSRVSSWSIFFYFAISGAHAVLELKEGMKCNSLGLISNAFHAFCGCSSLVVGLIAASIIDAQWKPDLKYTYGYGRVDSVAGMVNGLFLLFVSFLICGEATQRILSIEPVKTESLLHTAATGLGINFVGFLAVFFTGASQHVTVHHNVNEDEEDSHAIRKGMLRHVFSDMLGSISVLVSSYLMDTHGWTVADPVCSLVIAIIIMFGIIPLLNESVDIAMQRSPAHLDEILPELVTWLETLPNVNKIVDPHFWVLHSDCYILSITVETKIAGTQKDHNALKWAIRGVFDEWGFKKAAIEYQLKNEAVL